MPELNSIAWYCGNSHQKAHPVKQKTPNDWGLYDMLGNVYEWVSDWYDPNYMIEDIIDPIGPQFGSERVARSGPFALGAMANRAAGRAKDEPNQHDNLVGFRVIIIDN